MSQTKKDDVIAEVSAAFLGGGDEPATWAAFAYDAGFRAARDSAAELAGRNIYFAADLAAEIRKLEP